MTTEYMRIPLLLTYGNYTHPGWSTIFPPPPYAAKAYIRWGRDLVLAVTAQALASAINPQDIRPYQEYIAILVEKDWTNLGDHKSKKKFNLKLSSPDHRELIALWAYFVRTFVAEESES